MRVGGELKEATFRVRQSRFSALVELDGREIKAYLPNSGRMKELLIPGVKVLLTEVTRAMERRTNHDLVMVKNGDLLVNVDSRTPNRIVNEALLEDRLPGFEGCSIISREAAYGESKLDFLLSLDAGHYCLLETKSVTLVRDQVAMFPDAPTLRGARHLRDLVQSQAEGFAAAMIFIVQRDDANSFRPNVEMDPLFGSAIQMAGRAGITLKAFTCRVSMDGVQLAREIPVEI